MDPVCIIGAGPAGLSAAVALKARGLHFRILEAGPGIGGIWDMDRPDTPMYESAHFISSRTLSGFRDFPMPEDFPDYPRHDRILEYVRSYARHHDLERHVTFGAEVTRVRAKSGPAGSPSRWAVEWSGGSGTFSAVVAATGVTWHPNTPRLPGHFAGEIRHSKSYRAPEEFRGRRVLIVGGGNSAVDIACDAARTADAAFISIRRGYHFVPKYVFGVPSDVFSHAGPKLPAWLEQRVFGFLLDRLLVGDLTRYGLPKPDHPVLTSHPIMNTQLLHHLGHGDIAARPDVERLDGSGVVFLDGSREEVDLVLLATGYRRAFPFLELPVAPTGDGPAPASGHQNPDSCIPPDDLFLTLLHRRFPTLAFMGVFETDGAAYDLFGRQAEVVARTLECVLPGGPSADAVRRAVAQARPELTGGRRYVDSPRHAWYVADRIYGKQLDRFLRTLKQH
jgi:cation diffusion facilitator CzcD-associated flavoprotein CzcO